MSTETTTTLPTVDDLPIIIKLIKDKMLPIYYLDLAAESQRLERYVVAMNVSRLGRYLVDVAQSDADLARRIADYMHVPFERGEAQHG